MATAMEGSFEMLKLPAELQAMIFAKVESKGLLRLSSTCKTLHTTINDPIQDERLWRHKLPQCCNQYSLSLPFSNWLALSHTDEGGEKPKGMTIGKQTIVSYKDLACEVGKCVHSCPIDESKDEALQAEDWMELALTKWNTGSILHADVALAHACSLGPTLDKFVKYALLILLELLSLERAAILLKHAVEFIHDNCILGLLLEGPAAWDSLTRANSDCSSVADCNTLATRQIATLIVLMTQIYRFSQPRLQELVEHEKAANFKLQPLPDVFESLLSPHEEQVASPASNIDRTEDLADADEHAPDSVLSAFPSHSCNEASASHADGPEASSSTSSPDPTDTKRKYQALYTHSKDKYQPLPTQCLKFVFLGGAYRSDDLIKAMQLLGNVGQEHELCAYSLTPLDTQMFVDIAAISKMLAPGVSDVVSHIFTQPADFHKEFTAIHTWQSVARKQAAEAYEVLSPPYMCNRSSVWLAVSSYMTAFFLMRSKTRHQSVLSHMEVPTANSENVLVGCLIELTMELYSLGFLFAACNTSLLSILQNEVSANPQDARYELVGQFVDVNVTLLEHNHSHSLKNCRSILRDCVCWALALFRLGEPPAYYHLNPFVVQRLSKVLFCCMLRLPSSQQQQRAAKAAIQCSGWWGAPAQHYARRSRQQQQTPAHFGKLDLHAGSLLSASLRAARSLHPAGDAGQQGATSSLCRLCLQRMCRSIDAQPRELPLPEVNSRSLTKGPGLLHADAGGTKACAAPQGPDAATINASNTLSGKHVTTPELTPAQASGADVDSEMRDAADCDVGLTDGRDHEGPGQESNDQRDEDTVMETHQDECSSQNRIWPLSLPDTLTDEQGCESMKWLREWLAYGQSSDLDEFLEKQSVSDILGAPIVVPGGSNVSQSKPKSKWSWRWLLTGTAMEKSDKATTGSRKRPSASSNESRPEVTWLGELQNVSREIEHNQTWEDYDAELTAILGIEGGAEGIFALMPPENVGQDEFGCPWQTISRLYELLAQVCAALGINSVSALFYSLSVQSVMHLNPSHVLEDQLDPLQPGTAPLTVSRYLSSTLNHLATELITAADYPAALRALVFSRKVCAHELQTLQRPSDAASNLAMATQNGRNGPHSDSNEARALLTYATAQLAATILELRSRYGIQQYHVEGPVWPQKRSSPWREGVQNQRGPHDPPHMEVTTVDISYENMQSLTKEAITVARQCHVDSCLQALFVLGDMALVTYDLPEAQRILNIVALTAADGQVQHYNLVSQSQSFSAIASLSLGDAYSCKHTTTRCMSMFAFDSRNPMHGYSAEDDHTQIAFAAALDEVFGPVDVKSGQGVLSQAEGRENQTGGVSRVHSASSDFRAATTSGAACGTSAGQSADQHTGAAASTSSAPGVASHAADDTAGAAMDARCSATWGAAQDLASDVAGPSGTSNAGASGASAGGSGSGHPSCSTGSGSNTQVESRAGDRVVMEYETVTTQSLESQGTEDLMLRLMCQTLIKGLPHQQLVDSLQMRALALHMQDCPAEEEEARMAVFRNQIAEHGHPLTFRQAVVAACMDMKELLTFESTKEWLQVQMGQAQDMGIIDYLHAQHPEQPVPMPILTMQLAALGLVQREGNEHEPQVVPHAAAVWEMIAIAEKGGLVPDSETLTRFLSPTIPGFHFESPDFLEPRLDLLKNAASRSLDHVSSLLSLQHGVDCELQELSAIAFFMHQISLQVHIMYRNLPAARWALSLLTARPHDDASHVHTWYWAAAVANHCRKWRRAGKLFTQAARCTLEYPHMVMRTNALVGVCEAFLADIVSRFCPQLHAEQFVVACAEQIELQPGKKASRAQEASGTPRAYELHCQLCRSLWNIMQQRCEEFPAGRLEFLKKLINHALIDTESAHDPGAELRALLVTRLILEIEGLVTYAPQWGMLVWDETAKPAWCLGSSGLSPRKARFAQRMAHMQRNCFVTRTLLGCTVVVDPEATWRMACLLGS